MKYKIFNHRNSISVNQSEYFWLKQQAFWWVHALPIPVKYLIKKLCGHMRTANVNLTLQPPGHWPLLTEFCQPPWEMDALIIPTWHQGRLRLQEAGLSHVTQLRGSGTGFLPWPVEPGVQAVNFCIWITLKEAVPPRLLLLLLLYTGGMWRLTFISLVLGTRKVVFG